MNIPVKMTPECFTDLFNKLHLEMIMNEPLDVQ